MKSSKFNVLIPLQKKTEYLLYNTFSDSMAVIDSRLKDMMEKDISLHSSNPVVNKNLKGLKEAGFVIEDDGLEKKELENWFYRLKHNGKELCITIFTTFACNLKCTYCFQEHTKGKASLKKDRAAEVVRWIKTRIDGIDGLESLELTFFGGEPLLNTEALEYVAREAGRKAKSSKIDFKFDVITNGTLLTPEIVRKLVPLGLRGAKVTLDGFKNSHDRTRPYKNGKGSYETIIKNIVDTSELVPVSIGGNYDDSNIESFIALLEHLQSLGLPGKLNQIHFRPILSQISKEGGPQASMGCEPCSFSETSSKELFFLKKEITKRGFNTPDTASLGPCKFFNKHSYTIDPEGFIYKCEGFAGIKKYSIGSIYGGINKDKLQKMLDSDPWKNCGDCKYIPVCGCGCRVLACDQEGRMDKVICEKRYFERVATGLWKKSYLEGRCRV